MNKFKIIIIFSILTALMSFKSINEWYQYDSSEFKVLFPKMPSSTIKKINTEAGELEPRLAIISEVSLCYKKETFLSSPDGSGILWLWGSELQI